MLKITQNEIMKRISYITNETENNDVKIIEKIIKKYIKKEHNEIIKKIMIDAFLKDILNELEKENNE